MKFKKILAQIKTNFSVAAASANDGSNITGLVYCARQSDIPENSAEILCVIDSTRQDLRQALAALPSVDWVAVNFDGAASDPLIVKLQSLLLAEAQKERVYFKLLQAVAESGDLSPALSYIAGLCANSIAVIDLSGKIIAHSSPFSEPDAIWQESIRLGFCPPAFMQHIRLVREQHGKKAREQAFIRYCEEMGVYYLCTEIYLDNSLYGYVFTIQRSPDFSDLSKEGNIHIAAVTANQNAGSARQRQRTGHLQSTLLADMITGIPREQALARIAVSQLHFPAAMQLAIVRTISLTGVSYFDSKETQELEAACPDAMITLYAGTPVMLLPADNPDHASLTARLADIAARRYLHIGFSRVFSDPAQIREAYVQALHTLDIAERFGEDKNLFYYQDYCFYDLLNELPRDTRFSRYCHPALKTLKDYDKAKATSLFDTLQAYADLGFNQQAAAEKLFLHRNTMNYRRKKIEELTGIDFDDANVRFALQWSLYVERYIYWRH